MTELEVARLATAVERLGLTLAAQYVMQLGDLDQNEKADRLHRCGLANTDVAKLLGTTTNAVNVALHRARKGKRRPAAKKKR